MHEMDHFHASYRRTTQACGALVALVGAAALAGWLTGRPVLLGLRANYIPMAPNTALAFIVLGLGLFVVDSGWRGGRALAVSGAGLVGLSRHSAVDRVRQWRGLAVDEWFFRVRAGSSGWLPIGKMSLPTAVAFIAASGACRGARVGREGRRKSSGHAAGVCGLVTGMTGLVFSLGYLFSPNAPLLYGTDSIPMALNTALCFLCLGVGLAAAAGPEAFPLVADCPDRRSEPGCCGSSFRSWWEPSESSPG